jgi:hypothetical protein
MPARHDVNRKQRKGDDLFVISFAYKSVLFALGDGEGIHWPELDEDLNVAGLLNEEH